MQPAKIRSIGFAISMLITLALVASAVAKIAQADSVVENLVKLGVPASKVRAIGILELVVAALYGFARTAPFGALAVSAYLGGATAIHVRVGDSLVVPVALGVVALVGFGLRRNDIWHTAFDRE